MQVLDHENNKNYWEGHIYILKKQIEGMATSHPRHSQHKPRSLRFLILWSPIFAKYVQKMEVMEISMCTKCKNCVKTSTNNGNLKNILIHTHPNY
jgi:hypothetical protein